MTYHSNGNETSFQREWHIIPRRNDASFQGHLKHSLNIPAMVFFYGGVLDLYEKRGKKRDIDSGFCCVG
jgi:hypothetical protein